MSDSFIFVGDTGNTGDKLQSYSNTVGGQTVKSEAVTPTDASGVPFGAGNPQAVQVTNPVTVANAFALDTTVAGLLTNAQLRASALAVTGTFYQATQPVSGSVAVTNFPATQPVSGTVAVSNFPASQAVSGSVSVSNFPATQPVSGTVAISGSVEISNDVGNALPVSGAVSVSNFPATQPVSGTVAVSNFPASQAVTGTFFQATQPVSGSISVSNFPGTQAVVLPALPTWRALQAAVGTAAAALLGTPLAGRKTLLVQALPTNTAVIYVGQDATVSVGSGWPLQAGDTLALDIASTAAVFAVSSAASQGAAVVEVA